MGEVSRRNVRRKLIEAHGSACRCCGYKRFWQSLWFYKTFKFTNSKIDDDKSFESQLIVSNSDHILICANCERAIQAGAIKVAVYTTGENPRIGFITDESEIISKPIPHSIKVSDAMEMEIVDFDVKEDQLENRTK